TPSSPSLGCSNIAPDAQPPEAQLIGAAQPGQPHWAGSLLRATFCGPPRPGAPPPTVPSRDQPWGGTPTKSGCYGPGPRRDKRVRSIYSSLEKVEEDVHGPEKASKRLASLQAMRPATEKRYAAPPPDCTRYKM